MRDSSLFSAGIAAALVLGSSSVASAALMQATFGSNVNHGQWITNQFLVSNGFNVSAVNVGGGPNKAIIFNTRNRGTADPDLEGWDSLTSSGPQWDFGNLKGKNDLGKILILAENDVDANFNGLIDSPDDEGSRPAGQIIFDFTIPILELGFTLADIEGPSEFNQNSGYVMTFSGVKPPTREGVPGGPGTFRIGFGQFITPGDPFFQAGVVYGDHSANKINEITAARMGLQSISRVTFDLGGSAGLDNLRYTQIPEPATIAMALPLASLMLRRRREA